MVISENCCNFIVLKHKCLQTIIAMITEDKVMISFCMAYDFCKFFDAMMGKYTFQGYRPTRQMLDGAVLRIQTAPHL